MVLSVFIRQCRNYRKFKLICQNETFSWLCLAKSNKISFSTIETNDNIHDLNKNSEKFKLFNFSDKRKQLGYSTDIDIVLHHLVLYNESTVASSLVNELLQQSELLIDQLKFQDIYKWLNNNSKRFDLVDKLYNELDKSLYLDYKPYVEVIVSQCHLRNYKNIISIIQDMIKNNITINIAVYDSAMSSLIECKQWMDCLVLAKILIKNDICSDCIVSSVIKACGKVKNLELLAQAIIFYNDKGFKLNDKTMIAVIIALGKMRYFDLAMKIFQTIYKSKSYDFVDVLKNDFQINVKSSNQSHLISIIDSLVDQSSISYDYISNISANIENVECNVIPSSANEFNSIEVIQAILLCCRKNNKINEALIVYNHIKEINHNPNDINTYHRIIHVLLDLCFKFKKYYEMVEIFTYLKNRINYDYYAYCRVIHLIGNIPDDCNQIDRIFDIYPTNDISLRPISNVVNIPIILDNKNSFIRLSRNPKIYQVCLNILHEGISFHKEHIHDINFIDLHSYSPFAAVIMTEYVLSLIYLRNYNKIAKDYSCVYDRNVTFVTGKGNHVNKINCPAGVIRTIIRHHLRYNIQPNNILSYKYSKSNFGRITLSESSITQWIILKYRFDNSKTQ